MKPIHPGSFTLAEDFIDGGPFAEWLMQSPESKVVALMAGFFCAVIICGMIARVMQK